MSYVAIASQTLNSATSTVTFSSIPSTYRDLIVVAEGTSVTTTQRLGIRYNSDSSNYLNVFMQGNGSATYADNVASTYLFIDYSDVRWSASSPNFTIIHILDYAQSKHKCSLHRTNYGSAPGVTVGAGRWPSTSAITSIQLFLPGVNFASGSVFSLYGIAG